MLRSFFQGFHIHAWTSVLCMFLFKGMINSRLFNLQPDFGKTRSWEIKWFQTLEKFHVLQTLIYFFFRVETGKKSSLQNMKIFSGEVELDFSRPWFSEMRVQIKRPTVSNVKYWRENTNLCIVQCKPDQ